MTDSADANIPVIRDAAFAKRLDLACDNAPYGIPELYKGRQKWLRDKLEERFGVNVSRETVRRWFAGEMRPRPDKMKLVATLLNVDEAWLSLGFDASLDKRERQVRSSIASGAVNLVAGMIQMAGGSVAFPDPDEDAGEEMTAIIRGKKYLICVCLGILGESGDVSFHVPADPEGLTLIGVIPHSGTRVDYVRIPTKAIAQFPAKLGSGEPIHGTRDDGTYKVGDVSLPRISNFGERLQVMA